MRAKAAKHKASKRKSTRAKPVPTAAPDAETGRALLGQVIEAPDDDLARQVYADWLEEQGHPFAKVIRLQAKAGTEKQANAVIGRHRKQWLAPIAKWFDDPAFERGMLRRYWGRSGEYTQKTTQALLIGPASTFGVRDTSLTGPCKRLETAETLAWTAALWWRDCGLDDALLAAFAASPHLLRLSSLTLHKLRCTNTGLAALARSKGLPRLRHLALVSPVNLGSYHSDGVLAVVDRLPLDSLTLTGSNTLDVDAVVAAPVVRKLQRLSVATRYVRAIASSPHLTSLATLRISSSDSVSDSDLQPFLDNPAFGGLTSFLLHLWSPSRYVKMPGAAMLERLKSRFGGGFTYKTAGLPSEL